MAILNFLPGTMIYNQYQDYFKERNTIIFNESFCTGRIPLDIFRDSAKDAYKIRIEEINKTYGGDCSKDYYDFISSLCGFDYSDISQINLYFGTDMFCQINMIALIYYLEMIKAKKNYRFDICMNLIDEETRYSSFEESIKEKRYLTKKDIDDLVMAFIYLIHNQETYKDNLSNMLERVDSFPYLKRALVNYYYIRTEEFKKRCLMNDETKQEYVVRMLKENCDLGLPNLFYLSLLK